MAATSWAIEDEYEAGQKRIHGQCNTMLQDMIASEQMTPVLNNGRRQQRQSGRSRQRRGKYRRVLQKNTRTFLPNEHRPGAAVPNRTADPERALKWQVQRTARIQSRVECVQVRDPLGR